MNFLRPAIELYVFHEQTSLFEVQLPQDIELGLVLFQFYFLAGFHVHFSKIVSKAFSNSQLDTELVATLAAWLKAYLAGSRRGAS